MNKIAIVIGIIIIGGIIGVPESFALSPPADMVEKYEARQALIFFTVLIVIGIAVGFVIMIIIFKKIKKRKD